VVLIGMVLNDLSYYQIIRLCPFNILTCNFMANLKIRVLNLFGYVREQRSLDAILFDGFLHPPRVQYTRHLTAAVMLTYNRYRTLRAMTTWSRVAQLSHLMVDCVIQQVLPLRLD
jgi:hypothetical protein